MLKHILDFLSKSEVANPASSIGLMVSIIGFFITIVSVIKSKNAAQAAAQAAHHAHHAILKIDYFSDCSSAITILEEGKRILQSNEYQFLVDRLSAAKRLVIRVKSSLKPITESQATLLMSTIALISSCEMESINLVLPNSSPPGRAKPEVKRVYKAITNAIDNLNNFIAALRANEGN